MIFEDNVRVILSHNQEFEAGIVAFDLEVNKFCDLKVDEFEMIHTGIRRDRRSAEGQNMMNTFMPSPMLEADVEDELDWRTKGAVTPVKNQGNEASNEVHKGSRSVWLSRNSREQLKAF